MCVYLGNGGGILHADVMHTIYIRYTHAMYTLYTPYVHTTRSTSGMEEASCGTMIRSARSCSLREVRRSLSLRVSSACVCVCVCVYHYHIHSLYLRVCLAYVCIDIHESRSYVCIDIHQSKSYACIDIHVCLAYVCIDIHVCLAYVCIDIHASLSYLGRDTDISQDLRHTRISAGLFCAYNRPLLRV
jgi:hypothetical protein